MEGNNSDKNIDNIIQDKDLIFGLDPTSLKHQSLNKELEKDNKGRLTDNINYNFNYFIKEDNDTQLIPNSHVKSNSISSNILKDSKNLDENLVKNQYVEESEKLNENIIIQEGKIQYISIDLLIKKIGFSDGKEFNFDILRYFAMQLNCILNFEELLFKIESFFDIYFPLIVSTKLNPPIGIIKLLDVWIINEYPHNISKQHLKKLKEIYLKILNFTRNYVEKSLLKEIERVLSYLEDKLLYSEGLFNKLQKPSAIYKNKRKGSYFNSQNLEPILPSTHNLYFDILEWSEVEIARQLTLISSFLINRIKVSEFFFARWTKGDKYTSSPHIMKCIDRFNKLSLWITEEVLSYDKSKHRAMVLEKFILVAKECVTLKNYNDCFNIITTLNTFPIKRLNKSWRKIVSFETMNILMELNELCSFSKNFNKLRTEIQKVEKQPCVPYLGLYLKEMAFLEEGPKYFKDGLINLDKIKRFGDTYHEFSSNKNFQYEFKPVFMLSFLAEPKPESEENLIEISKKIEPEFTLSDIKQQRKRLSSTDKKSLEMTKTFNKIVKETLTDTLTKKNLKEVIKDYLKKQE